MQVGIDDQRHLARGEPGFRHRVVELGGTADTRVLDAIDLAELGVVLVPRPGIDQDKPIGMLDQEAPHGERNAVPLIGSNLSLPQRLGHHAEHRAAIEALQAGLQRVARELANLERTRECQCHCLSPPA